MGGCGEPKAVALNWMAEALLQGAEESLCARQSEGHGPNLAQELVPVLCGDTFLAGGNGVEEVMESRDAVRGQLNCFGHGVEDPSEDNFARCPAAVALQKLFD
jgi:hypothetical protein